MLCGCTKSQVEPVSEIKAVTNAAEEAKVTPEIATTEAPPTTATPEALITEAPPVDTIENQVEEFLAQMTIEEKVAQMFIVLPEQFIAADVVTASGEATKAAVDARPVGGVMYMNGNLQSQEQVTNMITNLQAYNIERIGLPMFISIDEEGGTVTRISGRDNFDVPYVGNMAEVGASGDVNKANEVGDMMGTYLSAMGFNLDFAPDADVLSNPNNQVVSKRSFGSDPKTVTDMAMSVAKGLQSHGVLATYKHFPGHGATTGDTHEGYAYTDKSLEELKECELIPFENAIAEGIQFIMVGHISVPAVIGDETPSSLSHTMITEVLREQMGYDGIVITDAMNMGAIVQSYSSGNAAIKTIKAGTDIILMPADFESAYQGVLTAVESGEITPERIDESMRRILRVKLSLLK